MHTPGPWTVREEEYSTEGEGGYTEPMIEAVCADGRSVFIATIRIGLPESADNARLIKAAPKLLEACKAALVSLRAWNSMSVRVGLARHVIEETYESSPEIRALKTAIAEAEVEEGKQ